MDICLRWVRIRLRPSIIFAMVGLLGVLQNAPLEAEGTGTGVLTGTVRDAAGTLLQGVVVEVEGPRSPRQAVTDPEGRYRFPSLEAGTYIVRANLLELTAEQRDVVVFAGRTFEAELVLKAPEESSVSSVEEWIQVIAEAPVIDRFDTRVGADVTFELIDELPVERFYQSVALLLPGVSGGEDGNPNTSGSLRSSNVYMVDGVDTTDPTTGLFGLNLSYEAVQEVRVTTAAPTVDRGRSSGAVIDVVTRSGGSQFRGGARWVSGGGSLRGDWQGGDGRQHLRRDLEAANSGSSNLDTTLSLNLGGPLIPERLWLFAAHQDSNASFLRPTLQGQRWDQDSEVEASAFKLTWQPDPRHTLVAQHTRDAARFVSFDPFSRSPTELQLPDVSGGALLENRLFQPLAGELLALEDNQQDGSFSKLAWNAAWGQNYSLGLTLADQERDLRLGARGSRGLTGDAPHVGAVVDPDQDFDGEDFDLLLFLFNGVTEEGVEQRPRQQGNLVFDALVRHGGIEHELKAGIDYQETESFSRLDVAGTDGFDPALGVPVAGQLFIDFDLRPECLFLGQCAPFDPATGTFQPASLFNFWRRPERRTREEIRALHISDTLVMDRWVWSLGLRWEELDGEDESGQRLVKDSDFAPRVGVTYDPNGDGGTVLSLVWGRYLEPFLQQYLDAFGRIDPLGGFTEYERQGMVGGIDCSLVDAALLDSPCWQPVDVVPFFPILIGLPNPELERSVVQEWVAGFERQVTPEIGLSLHWVDRRWHDLWNGVERFIPATGDSFVEVLNLPEAERSYRGFQLLLQKRFSDNWQLLASYTWSEVEGNLFRADGLGTFGDFGDLVDVNRVNRFGPAPYDRPHQLKIFGTRRWPLGRSQLTLGTALRYQDGVPFHFERLEDVGRRFLTPRGSDRLDGSFQWDLALTWDWRLASQLEVEIKGEVLNVTDEQDQLGVETLVDTGVASLARSIDDLQPPRTWRFTLGVRF